MSIVTLTLTDEVLDSGQFSAELTVADHKLDDGYLTAAHLVGVFLSQFIKTEEFHAQIMEFAREVTANPGCSIANASHLPAGFGETGQIAAAS